ncbi:ABC transporter ATP-binding protein [Streptomyces sp. NBC_01142]|uniref:ABC transporter ATP-binding protein n=1 Tax=Streptomyces sp. NBC_01142 TaxID=2975865 RepID=UPI00225C406A|nr:ABC transporter ATP-binding protein [Streptomyces sp. NBC_01142]MCX4819837.1 ABC transporter ATP-binding protein [Streptomyces sp. NBC_01142]
MLQAIGLTSTHRRDHPSAVDDLTFEAGPGRVTALLGAPGSGKTTALRLMLELESGRGVTYFRGNPLHRIAHPAREVGVLLGDVPGNPVRTTRGQLRMLCAAAGVPAGRADEMLEAVGLAGLGNQRLGTLSVGMDRRLGLASALLGDPQTLILDEPSKGLSPRESSWLFGLLRAHAAQGGTVLCTTSDPKEAARNADRVVTIDEGRLVADQNAAAFSRTRLRPRVAVRTPHAARLAHVVNREARAAQRSVEVVAEEGSLLSVYGSSCAEIGETAFRHGVLVHRLSDEVGDAGPAAGAVPAPTRATDAENRPVPAAPQPPGPNLPPTPPSPARSPLRPLRYELRRLLGVRTAPLIAAAVLVASLALCILLARTGSTPLPSLLVAWPEVLPLPPAAFGAGLIGALSFGEEYRYPALAAARGTVPRRLGLLLAKLAVTATVALLLALLVVLADAQALRLVYGTDVTPAARNWPVMAAGWGGLTVGCAWAGLLAAGVFKVTAAGVAAVLAVPVLIAPLVQKALVVPAARSIAGLPGRLRELAWVELPQRADSWLMTGVRLVAQPVGAALTLSLSALICAYLFTGLRRRARW